MWELIKSLKGSNLTKDLLVKEPKQIINRSLLQSWNDKSTRLEGISIGNRLWIINWIFG